MWGSVVIPRVTSEEEADGLAKQFAKDEPSARFGYGSWTPMRPNTAQIEYIARKNGRLSKVRVTA